MRYVLDANVALKWVLPEIDSDKAIRVRTENVAGIQELHAPDVFAVEVAHALTRSERKGELAVGEAELHTVNILSTAPHLHPSLPILRRAIAISSAGRIGVYDCLYVALAERKRFEFITADDKLVKNLQGQFPFIVALASLP